MADQRGTLTIDASSFGGVNFDTYISDYFADLTDGSYKFYGGTPDSAFGSTFYMNGDQIAYSYEEGGAASASTVLFEGTDFAYDFLHYGPGFGHGISGTLSAISFGDWTDSTTGTQGNGEAGLVTGLDTELSISGFDLAVAPGTGPTDNPLSNLFNAAQAGDAATLDGFVDEYAQNFIGSEGADSFTGGDFNDVFTGNGGADSFDGGDGVDTAEFAGAAADWTVTENENGSWTVSNGTDSTTVANAEIAKFDDANFDFRTGEWTETNFAPEALALDHTVVKENAAAHTLVGTLSAVDPEGDAFTWAVTGDAAEYFVVEDGKLYTTAPLDHEEAGAHKVTVTATDTYGNVATETFRVTVQDVRESIEGTKGDDVVRGTSGGDLLKGLAGDDLLLGRKGSDVLLGGSGDDTFRFNTQIGTDVDTIKAFSVGHDVVELDRDIFKALGKNISDDEFVVGKAAKTEDQHLIYNSKTGELFYDADGSGDKDAVHFATLDTGMKLTADAFVIHI